MLLRSWERSPIFRAWEPLDQISHKLKSSDARILPLWFARQLIEISRRKSGRKKCKIENLRVMRSRLENIKCSNLNLNRNNGFKLFWDFLEVVCHTNYFDCDYHHQPHSHSWLKVLNYSDGEKVSWRSGSSSDQKHELLKHSENFDEEQSLTRSVGELPVQRCCFNGATVGDHCEYEDRENQETNCVFLTQVRSVKEILHGSYSLTKIHWRLIL